MVVPSPRDASSPSPAPIARAMSAWPPSPTPPRAIDTNQPTNEPMPTPSIAATTIASGRPPASILSTSPTRAVSVCCSSTGIARMPIADHMDRPASRPDRMTPSSIPSASSSCMVRMGFIGSSGERPASPMPRPRRGSASIGSWGWSSRSVKDLRRRSRRSDRDRPSSSRPRPSSRRPSWRPPRRWRRWIHRGHGARPASRSPPVPRRRVSRRTRSGRSKVG